MNVPCNQVHILNCDPDNNLDLNLECDPGNSALSNGV